MINSSKSIIVLRIHNIISLNLILISSIIETHLLTIVHHSDIHSPDLFNLH